jgi:hypothetical protein
VEVAVHQDGRQRPVGQCTQLVGDFGYEASEQGSLIRVEQVDLETVLGHPRELGRQPLGRPIDAAGGSQLWKQVQGAHLQVGDQGREPRWIGRVDVVWNVSRILGEEAPASAWLVGPSEHDGDPPGQPLAQQGEHGQFPREERWNGLEPQCSARRRDAGYGGDPPVLLGLDITGATPIRLGELRIDPGRRLHPPTASHPGNTQWGRDPAAVLVESSRDRAPHRRGPERIRQIAPSIPRSHSRRPGNRCVQPEAREATRRPERPGAVRDDLPGGHEQLGPVRRRIVGRHLDDTVGYLSTGEHQRTVGMQHDYQVSVGARRDCGHVCRVNLGHGH